MKNLIKIAAITVTALLMLGFVSCYTVRKRK